MWRLSFVCAEPKWATSMSDVERVRGPAVRRRKRRLRAFWRDEQFSIKMAVVTMSHHSSQRKAVAFVDVATQTPVESFAHTRTSNVPVAPVLTSVTTPVVTEYIFSPLLPLILRAVSDV